MANDGTKARWSVNTMYSNYVTINYANDSFTAVFDYFEVTEELYFYVKNGVGDVVAFHVLPTSHSPYVKEYTFKSTKPRIYKNTFSFTLTSIEDDSETPWYVDYNGQPISYEITPSEESGGCKVKVASKSVIYGECDATIILKQSPSELCLRFMIHHNFDKIESVEVVEGCWLSVN